MRKTGFFLLLALVFNTAFAQIPWDQLGIRFGYNVHNAYASRFNKLIDSFNEDRYSFETRENLPNLNFLRGFMFGADYQFREDMSFQAVFKTRRQFISAQYLDRPEYRQYLFRQSTLELGVTLPISEEKALSHHMAFGLIAGTMGVFTDWSSEKGYQGAKDMFNIDSNAIIGLSAAYEARFHLSDHLKLILRPNAQYALPVTVRKLNAFFNPIIEENQTTFAAVEEDKFNKGSLNGVGIEAGLLILLPQF